MLTALSMLVALVLDLLVGWPDQVFRRIGHPVTWIGAVISVLDRQFNHPTGPRRVLGACAAIFVISGTSAAGWFIASFFSESILGAVFMGFLAWPLVAARSMREHFEAVSQPLARSDLDAARQEVSKIVGRDPTKLDEAAVGRAAIESLAENTSDGVIAPLFWGVVFGLPGIAGYKAVNTLDSMIGHRNERYAEFGWAAARIDDVANLVPARLTGLIFALVSWRNDALRTMWLDAPSHRSPNAGWPEAAMAGALGVRLSGPRTYGETVTDEPWVNETAHDPRPADLDHAARIYLRALLLAGAALGVMALL